MSQLFEIEPPNLLGTLRYLSLKIRVIFLCHILYLPDGKDHLTLEGLVKNVNTEHTFGELR